jgi:thiol-disulfide isomerase/thioredoxin
MKIFLLPLLLIAINFTPISDNKSKEIRVIKFEALNEIINNESDEIRVINFWATWCRPCIAEMPYFEALPKKINGSDIKVYLISMDFPEEVDTKVKSFVERRNITSEVLLLDETDFNAFIDKVDSRWSGAIPATLIIHPKSGKRVFLEKELHEGELEKEIESLLK